MANHLSLLIYSKVVTSTDCSLFVYGKRILSNPHVVYPNASATKKNGPHSINVTDVLCCRTEFTFKT
jgi:hypothetical protein